jgi:hypothetical protein
VIGTFWEHKPTLENKGYIVIYHIFGKMTSDLNVTSIALIIRFKVKTIEDMITFRKTSRDFADVVDHYVFDVWKRIITPNDIDNAFEQDDPYLIEMALLSKVAGYDFCEPFVFNRFPDIDDVMVAQGYVNCIYSRPRLRTIVESRDPANYTPLIFACIDANKTSASRGATGYSHVEFLLNNGADPNIGDYNYLSALELFCQHLDDIYTRDPSFLRVIDLFMTKGADFERAIFAMKSSPFLLEYVLERNDIDVDKPDERGVTILGDSVYANAPTDSLRVLIEHGADVNRAPFYNVGKSSRVMNALDNLILLLDSNKVVSINSVREFTRSDTSLYSRLEKAKFDTIVRRLTGVEVKEEPPIVMSSATVVGYTRDQLEDMTVVRLRAIASDLKIPGRSKLVRKTELVDAILASK